MKLYELTYLVFPELSEEEIAAFTKKIAEIIIREEGKIVEETRLIKRRLSYPIKKQFQAYVAVLTFNLEPEKLSNAIVLLKEDQKILRHLLLAKTIRIQKGKVRTKPEKHKEEIKEPTQAKAETKTEEKKVEIEDIEKKLAEILGEI